MIKITNLNKYYNVGSNSIHVIDNTSLNLPNSGLITLLGESGSGKTTLLNVIGGLDKASGTIEYDDKKFTRYNMSKMDEYRRSNIGYIFQKYNLLTHLTVQENLELSLDLIGITAKEEVSKRIEHALKAVGLYKFRKKPAGQLSGGQMQRVAIARALVKKNTLLIADEPTGNLDSKNSIEIMNILKKISENTLVLLVTHDKKLAEFYSDRILEISDGKITNIREPHNGVSLDGKSDTTIYLKDMNKKETEGDISSVVYSDSEIPNINLTLVEKNGTFYIKSNVKIKLLEESGLELVDDHYKETTIDAVKEELTYDTSWYDDTKKSNVLSRISKNFAKGIKSFFNTNKKQRFIRVVLFIIGFVIAIMTVNICSYVHIDKSRAITEKNAYYISATDRNKVSNSDIVNALFNAKAANKDAVLYAGSGKIQSYAALITKNTYEEKQQSLEVYELDYSAVESQGLAAGKRPSHGKCVVGKALANKLMKKFKLSTNDELFNNVTLDGYSVSGISNANTMSVYLPSRYDSYYNETSTMYYAGYDLSVLLNYDGINTVHIVGEELTEASDPNDVYLLLPLEAYINKMSYSYPEDTKEDLFINGYYALDTSFGNVYVENGECSIGTIGGEFHTYKLKGVGFMAPRDENDIYSYGGYELSKVCRNYPFVLTNSVDTLKEVYKYRGEYVSRALPTSAMGENIKIIAGKAPSKPNEVLVDETSSLKIGDTFSYTDNDVVLTVSGYYRQSIYDYCESPKFATFYGDSDTLKIIDGCSSSKYTPLMIISNDYDTLKDAFKNLDISITPMRSTQINNLKSEARAMRLTNLVVILVLLAISIVYIYFTMRSKMISDIYEIGVLRNIGASRSRIVSRYLIEILINTFFTTLIGYVLGVLIIGTIFDKINKISGQSPVVFNTPIPYLGVIVVFAINIIFGIIPITNLLRKTPSEISSKYDI